MSNPETIYEYLKKDHKKVSDLFADFEQTQEKAKKKEILEKIMDELVVHAHSEQDTFYVALENHSQTKTDGSHGRKEHKEIESQIESLKKSSSLEKDWEGEVAKLKKLVEHHVQEEENKIFDDAKKVLSQETAVMLTEKMKSLKVTLLEKVKKEKTIFKKESK